MYGVSQGETIYLLHAFSFLLKLRYVSVALWGILLNIQVAIAPNSNLSRLCVIPFKSTDLTSLMSTETCPFRFYISSRSLQVLTSHSLLSLLQFTEITDIIIIRLCTSYHVSIVWIVARIMGMRTDELHSRTSVGYINKPGSVWSYPVQNTAPVTCF